MCDAVPRPPRFMSVAASLKSVVALRGRGPVPLADPFEVIAGRVRSVTSWYKSCVVCAKYIY